MPEVIARQIDSRIHFTHDSNYESRGVSVERLIRAAIARYGISKDFTLRVWTGDRPNGRYSFATKNRDYSSTFPCFLFDAWPQCGVADYQELIDSFADTPPALDKVGWIGATLTAQRNSYIAQFGKTSFSEGLTNVWDRSDPDNLWKNTTSYMTYQDQIDRWKYLLDMGGVGWSGRAKVLLNSPRIVFLVDRPDEEWWFQYLEPWKHYVPVREDLGDLEENFRSIEKSSTMQSRIRNEQRVFARKYLTRLAALDRIRQLIEGP